MCMYTSLFKRKKSSPTKHNNSLYLVFGDMSVFFLFLNNSNGRKSNKGVCVKQFMNVRASPISGTEFFCAKHCWHMDKYPLYFSGFYCVYLL